MWYRKALSSEAPEASWAGLCAAGGKGSQLQCTRDVGLGAWAEEEARPGGVVP